MNDILDKILVKEVIGPILIVLVSILIYLIIKGVINNLFKIRNKYIDARKSRTINGLINNLIKYFIVIIDIVMILDIFGVDTKTLIASLGVVGLGIASVLIRTIMGLGLFIYCLYYLNGN